VRGGRVQYLQDPGHCGFLREDIDGEREELQKELDLVRKHSSISLKRFPKRHLLECNLQCRRVQPVS
jgi:hypothetical protein